jgi:translocation protein SEC63
MQLPHFTSQEVAHCIKGKGAVKSIGEYICQDDEQKKGLAKMSDQQRIDIMNVCKIIPRLEVECGLFVEDEGEIAERDLVTCRVKFTRLNVEPGDKAPPVHAPYLPVGKLEAWWVILADKNGTLIALEKITDQSREVCHDIKFLAPPAAGQYTFNVELKSDSYLGLDSKHVVKMSVISASELPEFVPHPDDLELDNEPTLFEQVMAGNLDDDSDEEDEDASQAPRLEADGSADASEREMNDPSMAHLTEAQRRKRLARLKRKQTKGDDEEDDDEDGELITPAEATNDDDDDDDDDK